MKINIVRLQDGHPIREPLDTTLIFSVEFVLDDEHSVCAMVENDKLYISSSSSGLRIIPHVSNAISIEITNG